MIELPDFAQSWDYENSYFLTCDSSRIAKSIAHYELFKMTVGCYGAIVECGVFKGVSLSRFAAMRDLLSPVTTIIGFDTFDEFPPTIFEADQAPLQRFVDAAGSQSIGVEQLKDVLTHKGTIGPVELISGDVCDTVPAYVREHPELRCSLINLDTDIYEPAVVVLETLYPRLVPGGVLILDDYGVFPGETKAVDEFFAGTGVRIQGFPFSRTPAFVVKPTTP